MHGRGFDLLLLIGNKKGELRAGAVWPARIAMPEKKTKTKAIAFGGILSGLAVVLMLLTGIFPFAEYSLPAMAGMLLILMVIEYGYKKAILCYIAVALLSLILAPSKEAAVLFAGFFGYYPILKGKLETLKSRVVEWILKLLVFNAAIILSYLAFILVFNAQAVLEEFGEFGKWGLVAFWAAGNAVFVLFDVLLTRLIGMYVHILKPRFMKKLNLH